MDELLASPPTPLLPIPELIQRYLDGEDIRVIAKNTRVSRQSLYNWMHDEVTDAQYPRLVKQAIVNRIADADEKLEQAATLLDLARARDQAKFARWDAERRLKLFQPKQQTTTDSRITVIVQRERPQPVVVEAQTIEAQPVSTQNNESRRD